MVTEAQIKTSFKMNHDELSEAYYGGKSGMSKATFDSLHGQIWSDMEAVLIAAGFMKPATPKRDLGAEIDDLKARMIKLEP